MVEVQGQGTTHVVPGESALPASSLGPHTAERESGSVLSGVSSHKDADPITRAHPHDPITSQGPHLEYHFEG